MTLSRPRTLRSDPFAPRADRPRMSAVMLLLLAAAMVSGCGGSSTAPSLTIPFQIIDLVVGDGAEADNGNVVTVDFTGWLYDVTAVDNKGTEFDSSGDEGFTFLLGAGQVIAGWDAGVRGMRVGGQRRLIIPPGLGFGAGGQTGIPPDSTLVFDIELRDVI